MDDFETISLDSKECRICKQETGEELISCVLYDEFQREEESTTSKHETSFAHRLCLERWDAVMKSSYAYGPRQKMSWKDRIKGLISVGTPKGNLIETWTPVFDVKPGLDKQSTYRTTGQYSETGHSRFIRTKEAYRVENIMNKNDEQTQRRKVRIRSVDLEDEDNSTFDDQEHNASNKNFVRHSREALLRFDVTTLKETTENLMSRINEVSSELICELQERDSLLLQAHSMQVSAAQLINLQSNLKTASTQNLTRSATCTRSSQCIV